MIQSDAPLEIRLKAKFLEAKVAAQLNDRPKSQAAFRMLNQHPSGN